MLYEHILATRAVQLDMVLYDQTFFSGRLIDQHNFGYVVIAVFAFVEVRNIELLKSILEHTSARTIKCH